MKIGILRETSQDHERRVVVTPFYARILLDTYPNIKIKVQPSNKRIFADNDYIKHGIELSEDLSKCDIILGVKEVDIQSIISGKKYLFFAHVAKQQSHNRQYFKQLSAKKITLLDYEYFTNNEGKRLTAFGTWAGKVAVYNSILAIGKRLSQFNLPPVLEIKDYKELINVLENIKIPPLKMIITGNGSVADGVIETLSKIGIKQVEPWIFISETFDYPVFCQLTSADYIKSINNSSFNKDEYYNSPHLYKSDFGIYSTKADIYFACHYWNNKYPNYLDKEILINKESKLKIIADISCDLNGPIASTLRESTLDQPFYDYNPTTQSEEKAFSSKNNINVMAVDNLPAALPCDSSSYFSQLLVKHIFPKLIFDDSTNTISRATILEHGELSSHFLYLYNFLKY